MTATRIEASHRDQKAHRRPIERGKARKAKLASPLRRDAVTLSVDGCSAWRSSGVGDQISPRMGRAIASHTPHRVPSTASRVPTPSPTPSRSPSPINPRRRRARLWGRTRRRAASKPAPTMMRIPTTWNALTDSTLLVLRAECSSGGCHSPEHIHPPDFTSDRGGLARRHEFVSAHRSGLLKDVSGMFQLPAFRFNRGQDVGVIAFSDLHGLVSRDDPGQRPLSAVEGKCDLEDVAFRLSCETSLALWTGEEGRLRSCSLPLLPGRICCRRALRFLLGITCEPGHRLPPLCDSNSSAPPAG